MEFLHLVGLSATGKLTLLRKLIESPETKRRFGIGTSVEIFGPSSAPIGGLSFRSFDSLRRATSPFNLHKWQFCSHYILMPTRDLFPDAVHKILIVWRPFSEIREAIIRRQLPKEAPWQPTTRDLEVQWNELIVPNFREVAKQGFALEIVDGSKPDYPQISPEEVGFKH